MNNLDLRTLFRTSIGFDTLQNTLNLAGEYNDVNLSYPPHNIVKESDNIYRITLAVAGFDESDLEVVIEKNILSISGRASNKDNEKEFIHRGISGRSFKRRFQLADFINITNAEIDDGLLHIFLKREIPKSLQPKKIEILKKIGIKQEGSPKAA